MKKIEIYSTETCGFCKMLRRYLDDKDITYELKMADQNQQYARELYEKSGQLGVPFTVVTHEDGKSEGILGFDRTHIDISLGLA